VGQLQEPRWCSASKLFVFNDVWSCLIISCKCGNWPTPYGVHYKL